MIDCTERSLFISLFYSAPAECVQYTNWTENNRNINYGLVSRKCDSLLSGWVRYVGPAGSRMLDYCPQVGKRCDTDFQGWINSQPTSGEVRVEKQVCWQGNNICCNWPKRITATHCGKFVVYLVQRLTGCYLRYCGTN